MSRPPTVRRTIRRYGEDGLLVELDGPHEVQPYVRAVEASGLAVEVVAGWSTALVRVAADVVAAAGRLSTLPLAEAAESSVGPAVVIEVDYDGPDLADVATLLRIGVDEVVARHTAPLYTVVLLGFSRGFPYLAGTDPLLASLPRRDTPRVRVPAGSVAVAAGQTGIYPADSPGGWHLLGRTEAVLFDPLRFEAGGAAPSPLRPGGRVRLVSRA